MPVEDPGFTRAQREGRGAVRVGAQRAAAHVGPRREAEGLLVPQEQRSRVRGAVRGRREGEGKEGAGGEGAGGCAEVGTVGGGVCVCDKHFVTLLSKTFFMELFVGPS